MTQKAKGPAEAATSKPSQVQTPSKGLRNMGSNNTCLQHAAIESGLNLSFHVPSKVFAQASISELYALHAGLSTMEGVIAGLTSQPKFYNERTGRNNAAGEVMHELMDCIDSLLERTVTAAELRNPTKDHEKARRAWLLLEREAFFADNLEDFAALASGLAVEVAA